MPKNAVPSREEARLGVEAGDPDESPIREARSGIAEPRTSTCPGNVPPESCLSMDKAWLLAAVLKDRCDGAEPADRDSIDREACDLADADADGELMWSPDMTWMSESISDEAFDPRDPSDSALLPLIRRPRGARTAAGWIAC